MYHYFRIFIFILFHRKFLKSLNETNRIFIFENSDTQKSESMDLHLGLAYFWNISYPSHTGCKLLSGNSQITSEGIKSELQNMRITAAPLVVKFGSYDTIPKTRSSNKKIVNYKSAELLRLSMKWPSSIKYEMNFFG